MTSISPIIKTINQVFLNLSPEKQQEVLNFVLDIQSQSNIPNPLLTGQKSKEVKIGLFNVNLQEK
ncbi:MAG: hypothetical protein QNJ68_20550 [Microcoleaceae cyanobacterium MO_207.B10]|nr:hypothetical protein [Microcoleaceae cyanobacterium MO_207.B10]